MTSPRDPLQRPPERGPGGGRRPPRPVPPPRTVSNALIAVGLLGAIALVVAAAALYFTLTRPTPVAEGACRTVAWDALPTNDALPEGWTVTGSGFYTDGYGASFSGPVASGAQAAPALNVRVSCFGTDGHLAVTRSHDADLSLGGTDVPMSGLGDEVLATRDASGTTTSIYIRNGRLVASIAAQGMSSDDLDAAAGAIDDAMALAEANAAESAPPQANGNTSSAEPTDVPEPTPTEAHGFPDLEALLPKTINGVNLLVESTTATDALGGDPSVDPLFAWVTESGKKPDDLETAQAYDLDGNIDAEFTAFQLKGIAPDKLRQELLQTWLGATESGITQSNKTIGGKSVLVIDYGDQGALDYVFEQGEAVIILSSSDPTLVESILSGMK